MKYLSQLLAFMWKLWPFLKPLANLVLDYSRDVMNQEGLETGAQKREWVTEKVIDNLPVKLQVNPACQWLVNIAVEIFYGWASNKLETLK